MEAKFQSNHCEFHLPFRSPVIFKLIPSLLRFYQSLNDLMEKKKQKTNNNNKKNSVITESIPSVPISIPHYG